MDKDWITQLNYAYGLDGGGYTWTAADERWQGFTEGTGALVFWEAPDLDYFLGEDIMGPSPRKHSADVLFFAPNSGHFAAYSFPEQITQESTAYRRVAQGRAEESDRECNCHGRLTVYTGAAGEGQRLDPEKVAAYVTAGVAVEPSFVLGHALGYAWEFTGNPSDHALPDCPRCDGDGYVESDGGEWAIYETMPECPECGSWELWDESEQLCEDCGYDPRADDVDYGDSHDWDNCDDIDGVGFADPGGRSSLRAETEDNPRDQDCPDCGAKNVLTRIDRQRGYCCNRCADRNERGGY